VAPEISVAKPTHDNHNHNDQDEDEDHHQHHHAYRQSPSDMPIRNVGITMYLYARVGHFESDWQLSYKIKRGF